MDVRTVAAVSMCYIVSAQHVLDSRYNDVWEHTQRLGLEICSVLLVISEDPLWWVGPSVAGAGVFLGVAHNLAKAMWGQLLAEKIVRFYNALYYW